MTLVRCPLHGYDSGRPCKDVDDEWRAAFRKAAHDLDGLNYERNKGARPWHVARRNRQRRKAA